MPGNRSNLLKENLLALAIESGMRQLLKHKQTALAIGAVLAAAALLSSYVAFRKSQLEELAWQKLSMAQSHVMQAHVNEAISILKDLISAHRSKAVLAQADYLLGNLYMATSNSQGAVEAYEAGLRSAPNKSLEPLLLAALGAAYEDKGGLSETRETYARFLKNHPDHYLTPRILLSLVRLHSLNKNSEAARDNYEKLLTLYPDTPWTKRAGAYLQSKTTPK